MKIAILGKGTSAIITALVCIKYGHEIEIYYDHTKPFLSVGESTTPLIGQIIYDILKITIGDLVDEGIVSYKTGVKFVNWGAGNTFNHHFQGNQTAFHFESHLFNDYIHDILKSMGVKYHDYGIDSYEIVNEKVLISENVYDFIIECSGWSEKDEYYKPALETVNSAILFVENNIEDYAHTLHIATENGWTFGLPFPDRNITKYGYLYNSKKTDINYLNENFKNIETKNISWEPKYSKKLIQTTHNAYNGNRLFFVEPLQALSLHYYFIFAHKICEFLAEKTDAKLRETNNSYLSMFLEYQASLAFHYMSGSVFQSNFWEEVKENSNLIFKSFSPNANVQTLIDNFISDSRYQTRLCSIGIFDFYDIKTIFFGMRETSIKDFIK